MFHLSHLGLVLFLVVMAMVLCVFFPPVIILPPVTGSSVKRIQTVDSICNIKMRSL